MRIHYIGDPHMGRKFGPEQGVPRHRVGEREANQMAHFISELEADADVIVSVGDLFDNPYVPDAVVVAVANAVISAAERNPDVEYFHMAGNHDLPKNLSAVGAWVSFRKMVEDRLPNLHVVSKPYRYKTLAMFPWEYERTALEQVADLAGEEVHDAIGHWDLAVFDGKDDHLAPVAALTEAFGASVKIASGHYHKPGPYTVNGVVVDCTGSMQPYTHGEDPEGRLYVTKPLAEVLADPAAFRNKYVRVIVAEGEEIPEIDCLGLSHLRQKTTAAVRDTLSLDDFNWQKILQECITPLDPRVQSFIKERVHVDEISEEQHRGSDPSE